ncbi:MAG: ChaN family lipoprotein [Burkholderiaceae bacterium]
MNCRSAVTRSFAGIAVAAAVLGGCTTNTPPPSTSLPAPALTSSAPIGQPPDLDGLVPTDAWLLGEQHDAPAHQALQRAVLQALLAEGRLAALVIEMAERGATTRELPADANESTVREALRWSDSQSAGWDWAVYGPLVMLAVRAGVPVLGGNLPRAEVRSTMQDTRLDSRLDPATWQRLQTEIHDGHCQMLPPSQLAPMTRVQVARDLSMARTIEAALVPGKTVLLVAGNQHVRRDLGVPRHWPPSLRNTVVVMVSGKSGPDHADAQAKAQADRVWHTEALPPKDHCAAFKARSKPPPGGALNAR